MFTLPRTDALSWVLQLGLTISSLNGKVQEWNAELNTLSQFAETQPHAAYSALTHGIYSKWNYLTRTTPAIENLLTPLEESIK